MAQWLRGVIKKHLSFGRKIADLRQRVVVPLKNSHPLPRYWKQSVLLCLDLCFIPLAVWLATVIRWGGLEYEFTANDISSIVFTMIISSAFFLRVGLYRAIIRFMGQQAILTVLQGVTLSAVVLALAAFVTRSDIPRSTPLIYWALILVMIGGSRLSVRTFYHGVLRKAGEKVAIYGAGASGRQLLTTLFHGGEHNPLIFIDDDPAVVGTVINGISVYSPDQLPELVADFSITQVFLALPLVTRQRRREIIDRLEGLAVHVMTVPDFADIMSGRAKVDQLQDIELMDLLGRDPIPPDPNLMGRCIRNKVVLVTGAGGSIGSELCRQILKCAPSELILLDISEYALYQIHKELDLITKHSDSKTDTHVIPLLCSVQNQGRLESIFKDFKVNTVYHAAAYKHVPLVEYNIAEGVVNNVFGTLKTGRASVKTGVETFVLISTDKAVRPTNVMGASKRMAELILQAFASKYQNTRFCMVRFGNVLGSSGSVVPLFRQQITSGGPVTVTHKDIIRYFMTTQEAAQLVLQASAMGQGGDVFVLDMGEPVKIESLARRLIHLMGHTVKDKRHPSGDIEIVFTGLRPGEKLYEELLLSTHVTGTGHPKILRAEEEQLSEKEIDQHLRLLESACNTNDCDVIQTILTAAVSGFNARDGISDAMWQKRNSNSTAVTPLAQVDNVVTGVFSSPSN